MGVTNSERSGWMFPNRAVPGDQDLGWSLVQDGRLGMVQAALADVDDAFWRQVTHLGVLVGALSSAVGLLYVFGDPDGANRLPTTLVLAAMLVGSLGILALPLDRIFASPQRSRFFGVWTLCVPVIATLLAWLDGSVSSPFVSLYPLALVFAASASSPRHVLGVGTISVAGFVVLHVLTGATVPLAWSLFRSQLIVVVAVTSAWLAASQERRAGWMRQLTGELGRIARSHRSLVIGAGEGIYQVDEDGRITFANPMACRILRRDLGELLGRCAHQVFHHSHRDGTLRSREECDVFHALTTASSIEIGSSVYWTSDGSPIEVDHSVAPSQNGGVVVVFRDVTELRSAQRHKDEFVSVVSHELRTPLTSIRGALGLLAGGAVGNLDQAALDMIQIASTNADRLSRLINDILDIERLESGKVLLRLEDQDMREVINACVDEMRVMADQTGIALQVDCPRLEAVVDRDRVQQVLTNLLSNAIKFSESGQAVVIRGSLNEDDEVQIDVVDQGRGIPRSHQDRIFGRFEQVDASDSRRRGGTGLGLAICEGLVKQHGGQIWVESSIGRGSTFSFTLPRARTRDQSGNAQPSLYVVPGDEAPSDTANSAALQAHPSEQVLRTVPSLGTSNRKASGVREGGE